MNDDIDLNAAHLRPAQRQEPRPEAAARADGSSRIGWEGPRRSGRAAAFIGTWWRFVRTPIAAYAMTPRSGGVRRPVTFALLCGTVFGIVSELVDSLTVALIRFGGVGAGMTEILQLDIAGRSLDWLPLSALSLAGCLFAVLVGGPLYVLAYSLLMLVWTTILHTLLKVGGGLAGSDAVYQGTLRAVCYSQVAMVAAMVPWIGDPIAILWSFALQILGIARMHGCSRARAALAVGVPAAALILLVVLAVLLAEPESAT